MKDSRSKKRFAASFDDLLLVKRSGGFLRRQGSWAGSSEDARAG